MNNTERDTHFAGFAREVIDEINGAYSEDEEIIILAQRAYDLVKHIMDTAYAHDICTTMDEIPDMPVLPEEEPKHLTNNEREINVINNVLGSIFSSNEGKL